MLEKLREAGGVLSFEDYMELALYDPEHGYYSAGIPRYGRGGDFLTAPTASEWYGRVMARLLNHLTLKQGPIEIVDLAAGDGSFLLTLLRELGRSGRKSLRRVLAIEQSKAMREQCRQALAEFSDIRLETRSVLEGAAPPEAPVLMHASELYDALPVARVIQREQGLQEFFVRVEDQSPAWEERPARMEVETYFKSRGIALANGQIAEANLRAGELHRRHLEWAGADALALTLDYGYEGRRLYDPRGRDQGSLSCYFRHEISRDPLHRPGRQDITAHVNWDDLRRVAAELSWQEKRPEALAYFLIRSGIGEIAEELGLGMDAELDSRVLSERQEIKRLLDPEGMGSDLKVLIQGVGRLAELMP